MITKLAGRCSNLAYQICCSQSGAVSPDDAGKDIEFLAWECGLEEPWAPLFTTTREHGFAFDLMTVVPSLSQSTQEQLPAGETASLLPIRAMVWPFEELRARAHSANNVVKRAMAQLGSRIVRPPLGLPGEAGWHRVTAILDAWRAQGMELG